MPPPSREITSSDAPYSALFCPLWRSPLREQESTTRGRRYEVYVVPAVRLAEGEHLVGNHTREVKLDGFENHYYISAQICANCKPVLINPVRKNPLLS